jgi:hypothetical protein
MRWENLMAIRKRCLDCGKIATMFDWCADCFNEEADAMAQHEQERKEDAQSLAEFNKEFGHLVEFGDEHGKTGR